MITSLILAVSSVFSIANANLITTSFAGGNSNEGAMFDLSVLSSDINVTGVDLNFDDIGSTTIEVYTRIGGYAGFESDPSAWTLMSSIVVGTTNSMGSATFLDLTDFELLAGTTYGMYFYSTNHSVDVAYTDGSNTFTNDDVSISTGVGINEFHNGVFNSRTWNGSIYYDVNEVPEPSTLAIFALALMGFASRRVKK